MGCWEEGGPTEFREDFENFPTVRQNTRAVPLLIKPEYGERTHRDVFCLCVCVTACSCPGGQDAMLWYLLCSRH